MDENKLKGVAAYEETCGNCNRKVIPITCRFCRVPSCPHCGVRMDD